MHRLTWETSERRMCFAMNCSPIWSWWTELKSPPSSMPSISLWQIRQPRPMKRFSQRGLRTSIMQRNLASASVLCHLNAACTTSSSSGTAAGQPVPLQSCVRALNCRLLKLPLLHCALEKASTWQTASPKRLNSAWVAMRRPCRQDSQSKESCSSSR